MIVYNNYLIYLALWKFSMIFVMSSSSIKLYIKNILLLLNGT